MRYTRRHRVLIATDGSPSAQAALAAAVRFPWPERTAAQAVVASFADWLPIDLKDFRVPMAREYESIAEAARKALRPRWPRARVVVTEGGAKDTIRAEAVRFRATTVIVGWRGHGAFRRLLAGSVSRHVAERAPCPVLVVRDSPRAMTRFVVGYDGCANAQQAIAYLRSLAPGRGARATLVYVVSPVAVPASLARLPQSARDYIRAEAAALAKERREAAERDLAAAARRLVAAGWKVTTEVHTGAPLATLVKAVVAHRAHVLVVGARATSGVERALLGSTANGALDHSPVPVLLVR